MTNMLKRENFLEFVDNNKLISFFKSKKVMFICLLMISLLDFLIAVLPSYATYIEIFSGVVIAIIFGEIILYRGIKIFDFILVAFTIAVVLLSSIVDSFSIIIVYVFFQMKDFVTKKNLKWILYFRILIMVSIICLYLFFGFNSSYDTLTWRTYLQKSIARKSFGFTHPNQFMIEFFSLFLLTIIIYNKLWICLLYIAIGSVFYIYTNSRTVLLCIIFYTVIRFLFFIYSKIRKKKISLINIKINGNLVTAMFVLFVIISFVLSWFFADTEIDTLLSGRLIINKNMLENGFTLLPTSFYDDLTFDNSFLHLVLSNGVLYSIMYLFIMFIAFKNKRISIGGALLYLIIFMLFFMEVCILKYSIITSIGFIFAIEAYNKNNKEIHVNQEVLGDDQNE